MTRKAPGQANLKIGEEVGPKRKTYGPYVPCPRCGWGTLVEGFEARGRRCGYCKALAEALAAREARVARHRNAPLAELTIEARRLDAQDAKDPRGEWRAARHVCATCKAIAVTFRRPDDAGRTVVAASAHVSLALCAGCRTVDELLIQFAQRRAFAARDRAKRAAERNLFHGPAA